MPPDQDGPPTMGYVMQALYILIIILPYILAVVITKNRKAWLWWVDQNWKATLLCAGSLLITRIVAFNLAPRLLPIKVFPFELWVGAEPLEGFMLTFGALENYPVISISRLLHRMFPSLSSEGLGLEYFLEDFLVLVALFWLLRFVKVTLAKRAYEIE